MKKAPVSLGEPGLSAILSRMSTQGAIFDFMKTLKPEEESGYIPANANQIALQTGFDRDKVNKTLFNLSHTHKIELVRGPNGRDIIGYRVLDATERPARRQPVLSRPAPVTVTHARPGRARTTSTPALDAYAMAKERFEAMRADFGELVEATFNENQYAEEGLRVKTRLDIMEARVVELQEELAEAERDLKYLRGKKQGEIAEAVARDQMAPA